MADQKNEKPARPQGNQGGWLSRIAPGIRNAFVKRETPENLWVKCPDTGEMIYRPDLEAALWVTPSGHHMRIGAKDRLKITFDDGVVERIATPHVTEDPLKFPDDRPYGERLKAARKATGEHDAMAIGVGKIQGQETFIKAAHEAIARQCPFVIFTASGGARMQEGTLSLMQMTRTTLAVNELRAAGLPYVVVLTDPTSGGVTASYAMLGDVHLAEPNAMIAFSGRRVIEQTIREILPPGFQRSEFLAERGMVDRVVSRPDLPAMLGSILKTLMLGRARSRAA